MVYGADFESGLCDCCSDCDICTPPPQQPVGLCSFCCPCIQFGRNVESHDSTMPCAGCCLCGLTCLVCTTWWPLSGGIGPACLILQNRINVRSELDYRRDDCVDFMKVVCCTLCVIAQDGRELKNHGRRSRHH